MPRANKKKGKETEGTKGTKVIDLQKIVRVARAAIGQIRRERQREQEKPDLRHMVMPLRRYRFPVNFVVIGRLPLELLVPVCMN